MSVPFESKDEIFIYINTAGASSGSGMSPINGCQREHTDIVTFISWKSRQVQAMANSTDRYISSIVNSSQWFATIKMLKWHLWSINEQNKRQVNATWKTKIMRLSLVSSQNLDKKIDSFHQQTPDSSHEWTTGACIRRPINWFLLTGNLYWTCCT